MENAIADVESIEREIERLDDKGFARLRDWFIEYDHRRWDHQIEVDAGSGTLDAMIDEAVAEHRAGRTRPL